MIVDVSTNRRALGVLLTNSRLEAIRDMSVSRLPRLTRTSVFSFKIYLK